jgi:hypothetical protein
MSELTVPSSSRKRNSRRRTIDSSVLQIMLGLVVDVTVVQHRLGRDTPDVQTSTPQCSSLFDTDGLVSELSGFDGGDISTRSSSDDGDVVGFSSGRESSTVSGESRKSYSGSGEDGRGRSDEVGSLSRKVECT